MRQRKRKFSDQHGGDRLGFPTLTGEQPAFCHFAGQRGCWCQKVDRVSREMNSKKTKEGNAPIRFAEAITPADRVKQLGNAFRQYDKAQSPTEERELLP